MASYDKLVKYLADKFQVAVSPLTQIEKNQEIIIGQNKQIITLLTRIIDARPQELTVTSEQEKVENEVQEL